MLEIFDRYRKAVITGGGVLLFLLAGLLTMLLTSSRNEPAVSQKENREVKSESLSVNEQETKQPEKFLYVYVTGEVKNPGVYKLSEDARIFQLIESAGGFTSKADREALNLAEFLTDGVHIHVAAKITQAPPKIPGIPARPAPVQVVHYVQTVTQQKSTATDRKGKIMVDINHADAAELEKLTGVGPAIAKRIIEYRNKNGRFTKPEDLINVRGIGQKTLEKMRDQIIIR